MTAWSSYLEQHQPEYLNELIDLCRISSVSAAPEHSPDVRRAAEWVAQRLDRAGAEHARALSTRGRPVVYGDCLHAPGKPTVLIYGHYDVSPADPVDEWTSPPFEPVVRGGRLYGRGTSASKGNLLLAIIGFEAIRRTVGHLPVNVKFLFEGSEESGSADAAEFVSAHRSLLACDLVLIAGGAQFSETEPALLMGLRWLDS
jgi:acetylornithine deacetylase/succinyl-diaminopimelate desuccinylase-like protein